MDENKGKTDCCGEDYCEMTSSMVCLANEAWSDLMKEKMKHLWDKERGPIMDNVADVVVKHTMDVWKARMEAHDMKKQLSKEEIDKFKEDLGKAFMG